MARQAGDGEPLPGEGWRAMVGPYAAVEGCECQAIAMSILERCGAVQQPAARDRVARPIAKRDRT